MAQPQHNVGQQGTVPIIKSSQIDNIPNLPAEMKAKYKKGLLVLEQQLQSTAPGSAEHGALEQKLRTASGQIMSYIASAKTNRAAGATGIAQPQRPQGGPAQQVNANAAAPAMQQQGSQQSQQPTSLSASSSNELKAVKINIPPQVAAQGDAQMNAYRMSFTRKAAHALFRRDNARSRGSSLQKALQSGQHGNASPQAIQQEMTKLKAEMTSANEEWEQLKQSNARFAQASNPGTAQPAAGNQQPPQQPQQPPQAQGRSAQPNATDGLQRPSSSQPPSQTPNDAQQAQTAMSPVQSQGGFQQQQQMPPSQPNMPSQHQATPQSATQPQAAQNFPQSNNMAQQQRTGMTAQQMMQAQQNMMNQQHAAMSQGAPQAPPQAPSAPQRPQALSHQAAMSQASFARQSQDAAQQHQQAQQQAQMSNNMANGLSLNPPQSATNQTPPSAYAQAQVPQQVSSSTKFHIPKQLNLDPRTQNPVQGPPSRPTFNNAGMMGQPGVQRAGQFTLEGEGDRVLSKRKLDELVRQVTGSTDGAESGGGLTSDVEEAVLTLADDFVDNLVTSACRLAKLRSSQTLDIRDLQIVLERNYGIRIPGYGLDEVRTVRKFQPAEGWRNKMQAVQAGKVMSSNAGKDA